MSTSIWGGPESYSDEAYPMPLLKYLLKNMMTQFGAQGACIALYDEHISQMRIRLHMRTRTHSRPNVLKLPSRRMTRHLEDDAPAASPAKQPITGQLRAASQAAQTSGEEIEDVAPQTDVLFAVGSTYPIGIDLIGYTWHTNEAHIMRPDDYQRLSRNNRLLPQPDAMPSCYLVAPVQESMLVDDLHGRHRPPNMLGVVVLYQLAPNAGFQDRQRAEALHHAERIALYLQNDRLQRSQQRTSDYLQQLQKIGTVFPNSLKLPDLIENLYRFTANVVDFSALLLTLYDRDTNRIYDVLAIQDGRRMEGLIEKPVVWHQGNRSVWWRLTQEEKEKKRLQFAPAQEPDKTNEYHELLTGLWGDQRQAESFLFLPMKMFKRVIGSLSVASTRPNAFHAEKVQVLETMVQIVTVGMENAKLYERDRELLRKGRQREEELAALNSALQSVNSALNSTELLSNFVESIARIVKAPICAFFQLTPHKDELVAQAMYGTPSTNTFDDGSDLPNIPPGQDERAHDELINMIRLPFKDTMLEQLTSTTFFYLDSSMLEELAHECPKDSGGFLFLHELGIQQLLMIPMTYQNKLIGLLAVPTPGERGDGRTFRPKEVGTLLALCAQAASAIRNAQLFEEREEAYAELERMNRLKDEFLVTASHELRTPLSAITGYSTLLKRQSARLSPQQVLRYATKIAGAAQQLADLVGTMTEAAKIGAVDKKLELQIGLVQLSTAANLASSMVGINIEQPIHSHIEPDLWVSGDPLRVRQVLTNLLDNAAKYSPPDKLIQITATPLTLAEITALLPKNQIDHATLAEHLEKPMVLVRVQDQGEGIPPEDQEKVFEKFVRAQRSLTTPVRGTGLGLFICRRFIEAMNGRLWLECSVPNEGSTFSFYLPRVDTPVTLEEQDEREYTNP